jgi:hypothetical protein
MALSITSQEVESVVRTILTKEGYTLTETRKNGENGCDARATTNQHHLDIECIGFQDRPPMRSKQFYEVFFRAISRIKDGCQKCAIALPVRFDKGLSTRARHYGESWNRIGTVFPELEIWLVDTEAITLERFPWNHWPND